MKLMNEIEAEIAGVVTSKLVGNGQPVEYAEALFGIRPRAGERGRGGRDGAAHRLSGDREGVGGRRRTRHAHRAAGLGDARAVRSGAAGGWGQFQFLGRVPGEVHRSAPAYRVPGAGR